MGARAYPAALMDTETSGKSAKKIRERAENEIHGATAKLAVPDDIKGDAVAVGEWRRMVRIYKGLDDEVLNDLDLQALTSYCKAVSMYRQAEKVVDEEGAIIRNRYGEIAQNPAVRMMNQQTELILKLAENLCITPAARAKRGLEKAKKEDDTPMARFLREHGM